MSDDFIKEWIERHDWPGSFASAKAAIDDAASNPSVLAENAAMREQIEHLGRANSMLHLDLVDAHAETAKETKRADELESESTAMREAIREAHATLEDWGLLWKEQAGLVSCRSFSDGSSVSKASTAALSKLQPFLKP